MRRLVTTITATALLIMALALPGIASTQKFSFNDVTFPNGQAGEIEATLKLQKNKDDSVYCGYFSADYQDSLGYYFQFVDSPPLDASSVQEFCLNHFNDREA